jgi:hypothetical protein
LQVLSTDSFSAKCSIIFNLCYAHLLPWLISPCQLQTQMEAEDCTLSINSIEFLLHILRCLPELHSEDTNGVSSSQFTEGPSSVGISICISVCQKNRKKITH